MEKIKVISIIPVAGKRFESVKLSDGRSATVWDGNDGNKNLANAIRQNLNVECMAELKQYNGSSGVGYNIRALSNIIPPSNITPGGEKVVEHEDVPQCPADVPQTVPVSKDKSIVAQCLTKIMYRNEQPPSKEQVLEDYRYFLNSL